MCVYQLFIATIALHNKEPPSSLVNNRKYLFSSQSAGFSLSVLGSLMNLRSGKDQLSGSAGLDWAYHYLWGCQDAVCPKMTSAGMTRVT